eukprot:5471927-Alexandrium_andersonii.AAC.1
MTRHHINSACVGSNCGKPPLHELTQGCCVVRARGWVGGEGAGAWMLSPGCSTSELSRDGTLFRKKWE